MSERLFEGVAHAALYAKFRPIPPALLVSKIINFLKEKCSDLDSVVDVGCGPGTSTFVIQPFFKNIYGLDVSEAQIKEAVNSNKAKNITFKVNGAEQLPFKDKSIQLVTAGQACHWFDMPKFFKEVDRILVPNGVLAMYGYQFPRPSYGNSEKEFVEILQAIRYVDTKDFWGIKRELLEAGYTDPMFKISYSNYLRYDDIVRETKSTVRELEGYVSSWSGVQLYKKKYGDEAGQKLMDNFVQKIMDAIGDQSKTPEEAELVLRFPYFLMLGRKSPT